MAVGHLEDPDSGNPVLFSERGLWGSGAAHIPAPVRCVQVCSGRSSCWILTAVFRRGSRLPPDQVLQVFRMQIKSFQPESAAFKPKLAAPVSQPAVNLLIWAYFSDFWSPDGTTNLMMTLLKLFQTHPLTDWRIHWFTEKSFILADY